MIESATLDNRARGKVASHACRERGPFVCGYCGVSYMTRRQVGEGEKYCSRDCGHKARKTPMFSQVAFNECKSCGKHWTAQRAASVCSTECSKQYARDASLAHAMKAHDGKTCACKQCGETFSPAYGSKRRAYCSDTCARRWHNAHKSKGNNAQRAKRNGNAYSYFNESRIFERDRWQCKLCGVSTPNALRGTTADNAPELDHIVSLADGGAHLPENVQCACRKCNSEKGARSRGQLWLSGFADLRAA